VYQEGFAAIGEKSCNLRLKEKASGRVTVLLMHICTKSEVPLRGEEGRFE